MSRTAIQYIFLQFKRTHNIHQILRRLDAPAPPMPSSQLQAADSGYSPTHGSPTSAAHYCLFPAHHMDRAVVITVVILFFLFLFLSLCLFAFLPVIPCIFSLPILPLLISCISIFFHFFFFLSVAETYHTSRASFLFLFPEAKHSIKMMRSGRHGFFAMKTWIPIHSPLSIRSGRIKHVQPTRSTGHCRAQTDTPRRLV